MATVDPHIQSRFGQLVGGGLSYAGIDQGVDFTGAGEVKALGNAVITRVMRGGSGWPGEGAVVNYRILDGPAAGRYVYVAEDFAPRADLHPGKTVRGGEVIGQATGSGKAPGIEVGWARSSGIPLADRPPPRPANQYTPQGADFAAFVTTGKAGTPGVGAGVGDVIRHVPGVVQVEKVAGAVTDVGSLLGRLADPHYLLRGLQVVGGAVLVLVGVVLLARQVGLAADLPVPASLPLPIPPVE